MVEKGHTQRSGKSGRIYPEGFLEPVGEPGSPADAAPGLLRCRKSDRRIRSHTMGHARVSLAGAALEPLRCRRIGRMSHSRRMEHVRVSLVNSP